MTYTTIFLIGVCAVLVILPPKWDPAIRWKEYNIRWAERLRKRQK